MFAVMRIKHTEIEELIYKALKRKTQLYEFWRCLLTLDRVNCGEFLSFKSDFYNINYASQYILDNLTKSKAEDILDFVKKEQIALQEFLEATKDFDYKEGLRPFKDTGKRVAEV